MSRNDHVIRAVRPEEWRKARELRLVALRDPAAPMAFLETYEQCLAQSDAFWRERTATATGGGRQFVAEAPDGSWSGSLAVRVEEAGSLDFLDTVVQERQGHVLGVFVRSEQRSTGLFGELMAAGLGWAWSLDDAPLERVRLCVHEANLRARAAYEKLGFKETGLVFPFAPDPRASELEMALDRP